MISPSINDGKYSLYISSTQIKPKMFKGREILGESSTLAYGIDFGKRQTEDECPCKSYLPGSTDRLNLLRYDFLLWILWGAVPGFSFRNLHIFYIRQTVIQICTCVCVSVYIYVYVCVFVRMCVYVGLFKHTS